MRIRRRWLQALFVVAVQTALCQQPGDKLPPWSRGTLDIHQIQTGRGNAAFLVFPDGTTLLLDAGAVPDRPVPQLGPERPNATRTPGQWIADYIRQFDPATPLTLDYAVITHYHDDHMGAIAEVAGLIPVRTLIDRGESPAPAPSALVDAYREFRKGFQGRHEVFQPGRNDQIGKPSADFEVRNIAANGEIWTGEGSTVRQAFPAGWNRLPRDEQPGENEFSIALRIRYGRFRYFTGGDLPGIPLDNLPPWHDLETPVARAVGAVDVAVLNHHGWLDTTNVFFLQTLRPRVVVIPAWHATHPDHGVLRRVLSTRIYPGPRDIFTTTLLDAPRAIFSYLGEPFQSTEGHIVVRVAPGGASYRVFILEDRDESRRILAVHGPYNSHPIEP
jgi:beta-lactamase superfamily II metal-dependent hydrolase